MTNVLRAFFSAFVLLATATRAFQQHRSAASSLQPPPLSSSSSSSSSSLLNAAASVAVGNTNTDNDRYVEEITEENPLKILIAGAGVGGLALAKSLSKNPSMDVTVLERTDQFKRFGGPIQLASNALEILKHMDEDVYDQIMDKFTYTGNKENGIKDGIRTEWYAKFDLASPAEARGMPYTGVIERPDLQEIYLKNLPKGTVRNGNGVVSYTTDAATGKVTAELDSGETITGDVLIGADGIWSAVRAKMHGQSLRGDDSGATYSGYTVFAGELNYDSPDNGDVGYKVYIGPNQYFVITDIGNGRYQWYAFLARPAGSVIDEPKPDGSSKYLRDLFVGWSDEIHAILSVTKENEIEQRDLYDRPPSIVKPWTDGHVALLGDGIHAMMPNLGQGGCQAIEDSFVITQELASAKTRNEVTKKLEKYAKRRQIRSAAVQGLSRFASDIIIRGFDTPAKLTRDDNGKVRFENFNYAGIVTRILQPILPIFFRVQFNFLYDGWKNEFGIDVISALSFLTIGGTILLLYAAVVGQTGIAATIGLEALIGAEGALDFEAINTFLREIISIQ